MKVTFLELRRNPKKVMEALDRNEAVTLTRRGQELARIIPALERSRGFSSVKDHAAFGIWAGREELSDPAGHVRELRRGRFDDL